MFSSLKHHQSISVQSFVLAICLTVWTFLAGPALGQIGAPTAARKDDEANHFPVTFTDIAGAAGLSTPTIYGGIDHKKYIIETNGCGVAFFDYDNDGWMDIFLLNGTRLEEFPKGKEPTNKLYHNNRDGSFSDATAKSGLTRTGWASAVTVGDYDNDGFDDLFITYWGRNA